jgi:hypothetical protein
LATDALLGARLAEKWLKERGPCLPNKGSGTFQFTHPFSSRVAVSRSEEQIGANNPPEALRYANMTLGRDGDGLTGVNPDPDLQIGIANAGHAILHRQRCHAARVAMPRIWGTRSRGATLRAAREILKLHRLLDNRFPDEDEPDLSPECRFAIFQSGAFGLDMPRCAVEAFACISDDFRSLHE